MTKTRGLGFLPRSISSSPDCLNSNHSNLWLVQVRNVLCSDWLINTWLHRHCCWPARGSSCWRQCHQSDHPSVWSLLHSPRSARSCDPCSQPATVLTNQNTWCGWPIRTRTHHDWPSSSYDISSVDHSEHIMWLTNQNKNTSWLTNQLIWYIKWGQLRTQYDRQIRTHCDWPIRTHYVVDQSELTCWLIHFLTLLAAARVLPTMPVAHPAEQQSVYRDKVYKSYYLPWSDLESNAITLQVTPSSPPCLTIR